MDRSKAGQNSQSQKGYLGSGRAEGQVDPEVAIWAATNQFALCLDRRPAVKSARAGNNNHCSVLLDFNGAHEEIP
jgi:hypothetical protein